MVKAYDTPSTRVRSTRHSSRFWPALKTFGKFATIGSIILAGGLGAFTLGQKASDLDYTPPTAITQSSDLSPWSLRPTPSMMDRSQTGTDVSVGDGGIFSWAGDAFKRLDEYCSGAAGKDSITSLGYEAAQAGMTSIPPSSSVSPGVTTSRHSPLHYEPMKLGTGFGVNAEKEVAEREGKKVMTVKDGEAVRKLRKEEGNVIDWNNCSMLDFIFVNHVSCPL